MENRDRIIIRTSVIGILANLLLAGFKAAVGLLTHSIAVTLDAVNNLSDALSSVITIIGTRLAGRAPDKKHPLGYGRTEYLSALLVAGIVLYAGITALVESVKKIFSPEPPEYTPASLVIIAAAVAVKLLLGRYVKGKGEQVGSGALIASGSDAASDAILSASVLASALLFLATGLSLEAWVGAVIAVFIIRAGIGMTTETLDDILGKRAEGELTTRIKELLVEEPEVRGAYDLFLYNYGPGRDYGSVHLEVPDTMTASELDLLTRRLVPKVYGETGVALTGVGVYAYSTAPEDVALRERIEKVIRVHEWVLETHGFYVDHENRQLRIDAVIAFEKAPSDAVEELTAEIAPLCPEYTVFVQPDLDVSN